jgi:hypothetical protein
MSRLTAEASFSYGRFSLPISINLNSGQFSVVLPKVPIGNLIDYIKNPINRIGIGPKYKWIQLLLGTQVPNYSELSVGDLPVFGVGLNLTPGIFRLSVFAGTTQLAIEKDSLKNIQGIYSRKMYSGKIGIGRDESSHLYLITSYMIDDTSSLKMKPDSVFPQKGLMSAIDYHIEIGKSYYIKGEFAGTAFTRDQRSKVVSNNEEPLSIVSDVFKVQESSRLNFGGILSFGKKGKIFSFKLSSKYLGDGFVPLGYPLMQSDRFDITIEPILNIFKSKMQISSSIGQRIDNLSGARSATTNQTLLAGNLQYQLNQVLTISGSYSNFGLRNSVKNDTLKLELVSTSWNISPSLSIKSTKNIHTITAIYSQSIFDDFNTISGELNGNDSKNVSMSYAWSKVTLPLNIMGSISYLENNSSIGSYLVKSININIGYRFFKSKLGVIGGLILTQSIIESKDAGDQLMITLSLKYNINKKVNMSLNGSMNLFKYGVDRPNISYIENFFKTGLTYKF